jgi:glycosyltransferase involved in cell wall biosynthesis
MIIVDDGSTDNTAAIAKSFSDEDPRVKIVSKPNGGVATARNLGIQTSRGRFVAFMDSDDLWVPHKLQRQLSEFEANGDLEAIQSGAYFINSANEVLHVMPCFSSVDPLLETLFWQNLPNIMSTLLIKRESFEKTGYFDTGLDMIEDWDFAVRLTRFCNFMSIEEPLSLYRVHQGNRSRNQIDLHYKSGTTTLDRLFADPQLPERVRRRRGSVYAHFYAMLSGGSLRSGSKVNSLRWAAKAVILQPTILRYIVSMPLRMIGRKRSQSSGIEKYHFNPEWFNNIESEGKTTGASVD